MKFEMEVVDNQRKEAMTKQQTDEDALLKKLGCFRLARASVAGDDNARIILLSFPHAQQ